MDGGDILKIIGVIVQIAALLISLCAFIDVKNREHRDIKYSQATQISVWPLDSLGGSSGSDNVVISNSSNSTIYDVVLSPGIMNKGIRYMKGAEFTTNLPPIPPGLWSTEFSLAGAYGTSGEPWVAIAFKDIRGQSWLRDAMGKLTDLGWPSREFMQAAMPAPYNPVHRYKD